MQKLFICEYCGVEFKPHRGRKRKNRFCSRQCCLASERDKKKKNITIICGFCGKSRIFSSHDFKNNKYCSLECASRARVGVKRSAVIMEKLRKSNLGRSPSEEIREKIRAGNLGKKMSEDAKRKISEANMGNTPWNTGLTKEIDIRVANIAAGKRGKKRSPEIKELLLSFLPGNKFALGHRHAEETIKHLKELKNTDEYKIKTKLIGKSLWKREEYVRKQMVSRHVKPNKAELNLNDLLFKIFPNRFSFVGDGTLIIDGKCPDFVDANNNIIELFGEYWHSADEEIERKEFFKQRGYNAAIIWFRELKDINSLVNKLKYIFGE